MGVRKLYWMWYTEVFVQVVQFVYFCKQTSISMLVSLFSVFISVCVSFIDVGITVFSFYIRLLIFYPCRYLSIFIFVCALFIHVGISVFNFCIRLRIAFP